MRSLVAGSLASLAFGLLGAACLSVSTDPGGTPAPERADGAACSGDADACAPQPGCTGSSCTPLDGRCGSAARTYASTATGTAGEYCAAGTATPANGSFESAATIIWRCEGANGGTSTSCSASKDADGACHIDGITWRTDHYEVIARGHLWELKGATTTDRGTLESIPAFHHLNGPCAGQSCLGKFAAFAWDGDGNVYYAVNGRTTWTLDADLKEVLANLPNTNLKGLADGPCSDPSIANCIDSVSWRGDLHQLWVTRGDRVWALNNNYKGSGYGLDPNQAKEGTPMSVIPALNDMCLSSGGCSKLEDFTWRTGAGPKGDQDRIDVVAGGRLWLMDNFGNVVEPTGQLLTSLPGFKDGPCK
jgi:hypothetical protein